MAKTRSRGRDFENECTPAASKLERFEVIYDDEEGSRRSLIFERVGMLSDTMLAVPERGHPSADQRSKKNSECSEESRGHRARTSDSYLGLVSSLRFGRWRAF